MIYPKNFENKIGFDLIREKLTKYCLSPLGAIYVEKIKFSNQFDILSRMLKQVAEFKEILLFSDYFPSQDYLDVTPELSRIRIPGTIIEQEALFDLKTSLTTIIEVLIFFKTAEKEKFPNLIELSGSQELDKNILIKLKTLIDDKGQIKDNASSKLQEIRKGLLSKGNEIDKKIKASLKVAKKEGWAEKDIEPTFRNNRLVIPISATYKRKIKGFIHDESATGQTVFIEPAEIFDTNNEIRELEIAERREVQRILIAFTDYLRPQLDELRAIYRFLGLIDFIRAKAKFAIEIEASLPILENKTELNWVKARHPLLFISHKAADKDVVPLNLILNKKQRILIISGPNAGGKSVCLKTVGLTQYMIQCGLLPSIDESSECGIFENLFIDIGDEQSLENDLSTYSSHLLNIKHFAINSNPNTIFLIDEFGTGTEPQLGGAIAEASLERLNEKGAYGVVTTHYANLKLLEDRLDGVINGAMLFDTEEMKPLYKLKTGQPGSSFAFEIAKNIGFPKVILKSAALKTGKTQLNFDQQLQQLEVEKLHLEKRKTEVKVADDFLAELIEKYEKLFEKLNTNKEKILSDAKTEASSILSKSNQLIEKTIKDIKEASAEKEKTKIIREKLEVESKQIITKAKKTKVKQLEKPVLKNEDDKPELGPLKVGDQVKVVNQDTIGEVEEIKGGMVVISFNSIRFRTPIEKLQKISRKEARKDKRSFGRSNYSNIVSEINDKVANFNMSIDVRGKRVNEVIPLLTKYIDECILLNIREISILHGKGDGVLRKVIREYISTIKEVKSYKDQHIERGGDGITLVYFK